MKAIRIQRTNGEIMRIGTVEPEDMRIEEWHGYDIRFVEIDGEWFAILKDICDALDLKTFKVSQRLDPTMLEKVRINVKCERPRTYKNSDIPSKYTSNSDHPSNDISISSHPQDMLAVNEIGIYEALFASRKLEARKFRMWAGDVMRKLRKSVGLEGYEVMRMTEPEIQEEIDYILDTLYWDDEKKCIMQSVTVQGGDVEQVPFEG